MSTATLHNLIAACLAGAWTERSIGNRVKQALGSSHRSIPSLVRRLLLAFPTPNHVDRIAAYLRSDAECQRLLAKVGGALHTRFFARPVMAPHPSAKHWGVPAITTDSQLCEILRIDLHHLAWLADVAGRNGNEHSNKLHHYRYRWASKSDGRSRLLEIPKPMLKTIQARILHQILDRIPPHPAAHAFRVGRSVKTNAEPHTGRAIVLRFDLQDFFPSIGADAVSAIFRTAGYPPQVAKLLVGLCTTRLPRAIWQARPNPKPDGSDHATWSRLHARHLPQGSPSSPALANLAAFHLDCRLHAIADNVDATYTRYADDLTFSGGPALAARTQKLTRSITKIVLEEGFRLNEVKTRILPQSMQQRIAGVVVNARTNVCRSEVDRLKATLTNCIRHGPATQNREAHADFRAHLAGRIAHVAHLNPTRGQKLWLLFDRILWPNASISS